MRPALIFEACSAVTCYNTLSKPKQQTCFMLSKGKQFIECFRTFPHKFHLKLIATPVGRFPILKYFSSVFVLKFVMTIKSLLASQFEKLNRAFVTITFPGSRTRKRKERVKKSWNRPAVLAYAVSYLQ